MDRPQRFSKRTYAAPFGRYQAGTEAEPPADEVLIGRAGLRAYLIDILLRAGRRGAFLITGNRGVGKSSFVRYCLREYQEEVFERFVRSNVGRTAFWDRTFVLLLFFLAPLAFLMVSELMELLVGAALKLGVASKPGEVTFAAETILPWVVIAPLIVVAVYPILFGWEVFLEVFRTRVSRRWASVIAMTATVLFLFLIWEFRPFGAPALSLSRLFCIVCGLYLWVRSSSFYAPPRVTPLAPNERPHGFASIRRATERWRLALHYKILGNPWPFAILSVPLLYFGVTPFHRRSAAEPVSANVSFNGNIAIGFMLLGVGMILQGVHLRRNAVSRRREYRRSGAAVYVLSGALIAGLSALFLGLKDPFTLGFSAIVCFLATLLYLWTTGHYRRWWRVRADSDEAIKRRMPGQPGFRPRPRQALLLKAAIAMVVGSQLVFPVSGLILPHAERARAVVSFLDQPLGWLTARFDALLPVAKCAPTSTFRCAQAPSSIFHEAASNTREEPATKIRPKGLFGQASEELHWVFASFLILVVLSFLDYEWVLRPYLSRRVETAIEPHASPFRDHGPEPGEDSSSLRSLARLTLPWPLYEAWLPVLTISVNLGFERLDHRRVVQAMLVGLRERFHRAFLSWNSGIANLGRLLLIALLLSLTSLAGNRWFALPTEGIDQGELRDSEAVGYSNICQVIEKASARSSAPRMVCNLGKWGDAILQALYFNLLEPREWPSVSPEPNRICLLPFSDYLNVLAPQVWRPDPAVDLDWNRPLASESNAPRPSDHLLLGLLVPHVKVAWPDAEPPSTLRPFITEGFSLRIYHVLLFTLLWALSRWLLRRIPVIPYAQILRRIDGILDNLTSSTSVTSRVGRWPPVQWLEGFLIGERVRQTQQEPFDPRAIEFMFLQILQEIQEAAIRLPGARNQRISLPVPEITFFFDELDKLGTRVDPNVETAGGEQQAEILNAERRRSLELHKLLADMKNLLSAAPARFLFVGGRNLHDEWLADQTSRQPLLTNIFTAEVYLPSLLTDRNRGRDKAHLSENIERFVAAQLARAQVLFERHQDRLFIPSFALRLEDVREEAFVKADFLEEPLGETGQRLKLLKIFRTAPLSSSAPSMANPAEDCEVPGRDELVRDFLQFLTYRSMGNPKRLKELLTSLVRPVGRLIAEKALREGDFCCDHVLVFDDIERFRIQLISRIYRHLNLAFQRGLLRRDDKVVVSAFYLSDFLFKFHRRAFSWGNLERVEDMVHIHRAPDLRRVLETLVERWAERFLHRIRNGMYDFRFRSEVAREIEHISRQSPEEMAEFNFTLDESQALKTAYEAAIVRLKDGRSRELQDLIAGLGELHEFDQEFETARFHYRHAISLLDADLRAITGGSEVLEESSPMMQILARRPPGPGNARLYMTWGIARLRLMLQVGMTYELARNHERASVEYDNAGTLARSLLFALLDHQGRLLSEAYEKRRDVEPPKGGREEPLDDRLDVLKHLNLLFQPVFAGAWVSEKLIGAVDTSVTLVEETLDELRAMLPFVREARVSPAMGPVRVGHSNFALIAAELHNKAGDLYFLKGRQVTSREAIAAFAKERKLWRAQVEEWRKQSPPSGPRPSWMPRHGQEGYLLRAHLHYAVGLHELRRFIAYRKLSSAEKWNVKSSDAFAERSPGARETIETEGWPDYVFRSLGGTFNDFAEVMLGRVSIYGILRTLADFGLRPPTRMPEGEVTDRATEALVRVCSKWLELPSVRNQEQREKARGEEAAERRAKLVEPDLLEVAEREAAEAEQREAEAVDHRIVIPLGDKRLDCGTLGGWFGYWNEEWKPTERQKKIVSFDEWKEHDDLERLSVALNLMLVGAKYLERGGYFEDGAREFLKVAEVAASYLWWWRIVCHLVDHLGKGETPYEVLVLDREACTAEVRKHPFWGYLGSLAQYGLEKADQLFRQSRQSLGETTYLVGEKIPVSCLGTACSLGLVSLQLGQADDVGWAQPLLERTVRLISRWTGADAKWTESVDRAKLVEVLETTLERHSYPMLARLNGLNLRIVEALLAGAPAPDVPEPIRADCQELFELTEDLNSPLHFTPMQPGITFALVYLLRGENTNPCDSEIETFRRRAQHYLLRSEEMYTLKRAFYEGIADLYFLYDDFNDRQVHFHHALQMAGSELVTMLRYLVTSKDYEGIIQDPLTLAMGTDPMAAEVDSDGG